MLAAANHASRCQLHHNGGVCITPLESRRVLTRQSYPGPCHPPIARSYIASEKSSSRSHAIKCRPWEDLFSQNLDELEETKIRLTEQHNRRVFASRKPRISERISGGIWQRGCVFMSDNFVYGLLVGLWDEMVVDERGSQVCDRRNIKLELRCVHIGIAPIWSFDVPRNHPSTSRTSYWRAID
jgi:hypothetical protein